MFGKFGKIQPEFQMDSVGWCFQNKPTNGRNCMELSLAESEKVSGDGERRFTSLSACLFLQVSWY